MTKSYILNADNGETLKFNVEDPDLVVIRYLDWYAETGDPIYIKTPQGEYTGPVEHDVTAQQ